MSTPSEIDAHIDRAQFDEIRILLASGFPGFVQKFHLAVRDGLVALDAASAAGDGPALHQAAHRLKGAAGFLGTTSLVAQCAHLEALARNGDMHLAPSRIALLKHTYRDLCSLLESYL